MQKHEGEKQHEVISNLVVQKVPSQTEQRKTSLIYDSSQFWCERNLGTV